MRTTSRTMESRVIVWLAAASSASKEPAKQEKTCFDIVDEETQVRLWWMRSCQNTRVLWSSWSGTFLWFRVGVHGLDCWPGKFSLHPSLLLRHCLSTSRSWKYHVQKVGQFHSDLRLCRGAHLPAQGEGVAAGRSSRKLASCRQVLFMRCFKTSYQTKSSLESNFMCDFWVSPQSLQSDRHMILIQGLYAFDRYRESSWQSKVKS